MTLFSGCVYYIERHSSFTFVNDAWNRVNYIQYFKNTHFFYGKHTAYMMKNKQRQWCPSQSRPRASHGCQFLMFRIGELCLENCYWEGKLLLSFYHFHKIDNSDVNSWILYKVGMFNCLYLLRVLQIKIWFDRKKSEVFTLLTLLHFF